MLRPSEILLETRSARSKILAVKLARSLEAPLGLNYRVWRSSSSMLETRSARSKILGAQIRSLGLSTTTQHTTTIYLLSFMLDVQYRSYIATDDCLCLSSMHHRKLAHPSFFLDCLSRDIGIIPPLFSNITNYWLS